MSNLQHQAARAFAFTGATLLIGVVIFFFTQGVIPLVQLPDIAGPVFALGFFLIFLNLSFALGRRFCSRTFEMEHFPYILAFVLLLPTLVLSAVTERLSGLPAYATFSGVLIIAGMAGAFLGIRSGRRKRERLVREAMESDDTENES
ncbi:hypothetical protein QA596_04835 [Balneolales bacterium ANBcel1]|nr:hypothetical protein [Balneolales bacterium ANBcel1]